MEKYKYADTAKINVKPDGSVVCSLYVNDSKEKKEYFKNAARMKKVAGSNGNSKKKRTVTVSKSTKARHKDKLKVESYLQANSWEYVLRVPVTSVDHATTWRKFMQRYNYRHKDHPLQYVMVKGDGELYGVISNAPVEGENIPLVNVEHSIVSAFDNSMIKQMTALSLQYEYKGNEKSFVSSNGLKKKSFEFVNLGGFEMFSLPDDALVTQMQASLVFNGGTVEENLAAARRFIKEKRVDRVSIDEAKKYNNAEDLAADSVAMTGLLNEFKERVFAASNNDYIKNVGVYGANSSEFEYGHSVNANTNSIRFAAMKSGTIMLSARWLVESKKWDELRRNIFPTVYYWQNIETRELIYVGLSATPITRHTDHLARNNYENRKADGVYDRYIVAEGVPSDKLKALYLPVGYYRELSEFGGNIKDYATDIKTLELAEARLQRRLVHVWKKGTVRTDIFLGAAHDDVLKAERLFIEKLKSGQLIEKAADEAATIDGNRVDRLKQYLKRNAEYDMKNQPLEKCMNYWHNFFKGVMSVENKNGFVELKVIADLLRKSRFGLEDLQKNVIATEPETAGQRWARVDKLGEIWEKENEMAQIDGWIPEFD